MDRKSTGHEPQHIKALSLDETQKALVPLFKKLQETCDKAGVKYYTVFGTLIGAARHQGFIPWDDDVDVAMLDEDFFIFRDYCQRHEEELLPYRLMGFGNTPGYPFNLHRFCDTRYGMESDIFPDAGMGAFIDIYRLSAAGNDPQQLAKRVAFRQKLYYRGLIYNTMKKFVSSLRNPFKRTLKYLIFRSARLFGKNIFHRGFEKLGQMYDMKDSSYVALLTWEEEMFVYPKEWFGEGAALPFEGLEVRVPKEWKAMLKKDYGDYMKLPPEEDRIPHHYYRIYRKDSM